MEDNAQGISLWRRVSESLLADIDRGVLKPGSRVPADTALAARFGVNRHTVRRAFSYLAEQGVVRSEQGRGTFVAEDVVAYRLGARNRFEENLLETNRKPLRRVLAVQEMPSTPRVAAALKVKVGTEVLFVKLASEADDVPLSLGYLYFPPKRVVGIADAIRAYGAEATGKLSFGDVLKSLGVPDFRRQVIRIRARMPNRDESKLLKMPTSEQVLETDVVSVDPSNRPIIYAQSCFPSSRVEFVIDV